MNDIGWVHIVALAGWLVLAAGAYASYRMSWSETIRLVLIWAGIFVAVGLLLSLVMR
jgi:hypothetical protein